MILETSSFASRPGTGTEAYSCNGLWRALDCRTLHPLRRPIEIMDTIKEIPMRNSSPNIYTVIDVLNDRMFRQTGANFDRRNNVIAANDVGRQMKLVHWCRLERLGASDILATAVQKMPFQVSSTWSRQSRDHDGEPSMALCIDRRITIPTRQ